MVRTRTRHHRRSRHHRFQQTYLLRHGSTKRLRSLFMSPLLVIALSLIVNHSRGSVEASQLMIQPRSFPKTVQLAAFAQASIASLGNQQGEQVILNGRPLTAAWSQQQQQVGISDAGLMQAIGVDLLDTNDAGKQPLEWFSDQRTTPIVLPTWLSGQYRYLDISELAQRFGWQTQINGKALQISTPPAKVTAVRQGIQEWGDRIALDLDQATPWQVSEQSGEAVITIDAQIDPALIRGFRAGPAKQLNALKVETNGNQTIIRLGFPDNVRPRVWSLPNPKRLLIDIRPDSVEERNILWAPGIRWKQQLINLGAERFPVVSLEVDLRQPGVKLKPIVSNPLSLVGTAPLLTTAQKSQVVAAINAGFFNRNTQLPLGAIRKDRQWVSGPILNRGAIAWNDTGEVAIGHLSLRETITTSTGQRFPMQSVNSGFVGAGIARYTSEWGSRYTPILANEVLITVQNDKVVDQMRAGAVGQTTIPIPPNGYLLALRADDSAIDALAVGTTVQVQAMTEPAEFDQYSQVLGAGPLLIKNRQIVLNPQSEQFSTAFVQQSAPRSVIATTAAGTLTLTAVHHRIGGSGPTLAEIAQIMQQAGAVNALNLDGGSSTSLYLGGQLLDRASSTAARVHNGIGVFIQPNP